MAHPPGGDGLGADFGVGDGLDDFFSREEAPLTMGSAPSGTIGSGHGPASQGAGGAPTQSSGGPGPTPVGNPLLSAAMSQMGALAGKAGVSTAMQEAVAGAALQETREKYGKYLKGMKPWMEFLLPISRPGNGEACSRMGKNFFYFQTNYVTLFVCQLLFTVMVTPSSLVCVISMAVVWLLFTKKNEDPDWNPVIMGIALPPTLRMLCLAALTAIVFLVVAGNLLFSTSVFFLLCAGVHAALHTPPAGGDGEDGGAAASNP